MEKRLLIAALCGVFIAFPISPVAHGVNRYLAAIGFHEVEYIRRPCLLMIGESLYE